MSDLAGRTLKQLFPYKGIGAAGNLATQNAKVLPATGTGTLFTVTGSVVVLGMVGVVSTVFTATSVNISLGITGSNAAIAANPAAAYASTTVGSVVQLPAVLGGALPAAVAVKGTAAAFNAFVVKGTNITITTDATNTGAITWLLVWTPLFRKSPGSVSAP